MALCKGIDGLLHLDFTEGITEEQSGADEEIQLEDDLDESSLSANEESMGYR